MSVIDTSLRGVDLAVVADAEHDSTRPWPALTYPGARAAAGWSLVGADAVAWLLCVLLVYAVPTLMSGHFPPMWAVWPAGLAWLAWLAFRSALRLYPPYGIPEPEELRRSVLATSAAFATHAAMLLGAGQFAGWRVIGLGIWLLVIPAAWFCRHFAKRQLIGRSAWGVPYVVIGTGALAGRVIREMRENPDLGLVPMAAFGDRPATGELAIEGVPILGTVDAAMSHEYPYRVRHAIVAMDGLEASGARLTEITTTLARRHPTIQLFHDLRGVAYPWIRPRPLGPCLMLQVQNARFSARQRVLKRAFDLAIAVPVFLMALPVIALAALAVRLASAGPAFFSQTREGRDGSPIRIWKLRTMIPDAERRLAEYLAVNEAARFEYERTLKLRSDPRIIPKVGAFLRRASIDELPQLWNIIRGDMSLVGPRVMPTREVDLYTEGGRMLRRDVPPGLTGLWQVMHRNNSSLHIREVTDSYYVNNWSIWLDAWILLKTAGAVLDTSGAY